MTRLNSIKKPISVLAFLLCFFMVLSFVNVKTVSADNVSETELTQLYNEALPTVQSSGVDPNGHFTKIYETRYGVKDLAYEKMVMIYSIADAKIYIFETVVTDAKIQDYTYENRKRASEIRDEFGELFTVDEQIATATMDQLEAYSLVLSEKATALFEELVGIIVDDIMVFVDYLLAACEEIDACYKELVAFTDENTSVSERNSYKVYIPAQRNAIKEIYEKYVTVDSDGSLFPNMDDAFSNYGVDFEYHGSKYNEYVKEVDAIVEEALKALRGVSKNNIELAYDAFNDWLYEASQPDLTAEQKQEIREKAEAIVKKGVSVYESANSEVKSHYEAEYKILKDFLDKAHAEVGDFTTDSYTVRGVKITALYADNKQKADVIPRGLELKVYPSYNGSASRNVSKFIKEKDKELTVSYLIFMQFYANPGTGFEKPYTLPEKDKETGRAVIYQIEVDLSTYYQNYLSNEKFLKDETENINKAHARITADGYTAGTSLCYSYTGGNTKGLDYEVKEGGKIVFYANNLCNFCFAGIDTSTLFTSPIFWAIAVGALILLIILIKILIKRVRYSIIFNSNGGSRVKKVKASKNEYFVMPAAPVKANFVFAGWYTDKELTNKFIGVRMLRRKKIKLYAKWAAPASQERLKEYYDALRKNMMGYQKVSFKPTLGLVEKEHLASIYCRENNVELYLAIAPEKAKAMGFEVIAHDERKFAKVPSKFIVSTEESFANALKLVADLFTSKGLQLREDKETSEVAANENRENGFAYYITNERVASTPADYFELLRLALKGYALEKDPGCFKAGEKFTFARIYVTDLEAQLYLPNPNGIKAARIRDARFEDTPNLVSIKSINDIPEAYDKIDELMLSYGFTKCPENSNDIQDVDVPDGNGFAYAIKF